MPKRYKILITGSSGMLGIDLSREMGERYEVYGVDIVHSPSLDRARDSLRSQSTVHGFQKGDITDKKNIASVFKKINPDIVIHTAAWTDVDGCELDAKKAYRINSDGTKNIALACKRCNATLVYISTDFVFDGRKEKAYTEKDRPHPISVYAGSKLKGEEAVKKLIKKYYILRTSWLYGREGKNFVDTIMAKGKTGRVLRVVNDQVGSPTYTKDLANAISVLLRLVHSPQSTVHGYGTYHISNAGSVSWYGYAKEILKLAGSGTKVIPISSEELDRAARRPAMSVLNNSKFLKLTEYRMRNWKGALKDYILKEKRGQHA